MSIEFLPVKSTSAEQHAEDVQTLRNQGWERVFSAVQWATTDSGCDIYLSYMERDTAAATVHKNGVYLASLMEVLENRVTEHDTRLEVIEATLDDDSQPPRESIPHFNPFGTLIGFVESPDQLPRTYQFIPTDAIWYRETVEEALTEDEAREGSAK